MTLEGPLRLIVLEPPLAVCRLPADAPVPAEAAEARGGPLTAITRTDDELSIVCSWDRKPAEAPAEGPFRALKVLGPLDFSLVGILASLTRALARAEISVFALSTFDTDYLLVPAPRLAEAASALRDGGFEVDGTFPEEAG